MADSRAERRDLSLLPSFSFTFVETYLRNASKCTGDKELHKGYKYFCENFVHDIKLLPGSDRVTITAKCFHSQKRNETPHVMKVAMSKQSVDSGHPVKILEARCSCAIGLSGCCGHVTGVLYQLASYKMQEIKTIPADVAKTTRLQASDPKWHRLRYDRITASKAGEIYKRKKNFETLKERYKTTRHRQTEAMRRGVICEPKAAHAYSEVLNDAINVLPCGIVISPWCPWLAASPDRKVYNPQRANPFGLLEIKCPDVSSVLEVQYLERDADQNFLLKQNHNYYFQVLMQLAVTGLTWCDFFVWTESDSALVTISFDKDKWQDVQNKLDVFYFEYFL